MRSDEQRPDHSAAVAGDNTDAHVGIREARLLGHHRDVREQGNRRSQTDCVAVNRADNRLFDVEHIFNDAARLGGRPQRALPAVRGARAIRHSLDVAAGAEGARPAPVRMIAFTSSSTARSSQIVHSSRWSTGLTALSESGRLSVTVATRLAFSTLMVSYLL